MKNVVIAHYHFSLPCCHFSLFDLEGEVDWSEDWQIKFNNKKGNHMHLGPENIFSKYYMTRDKSGEPIVIVQEEKDLGVTFDHKLKFSLHIQNSVRTANRTSGLLEGSSHV